MKQPADCHPEIELIWTLLSDLQSEGTPDPKTEADQLLLTELSDDELSLLIKMMLPHARQERLSELLAKNSCDPFSEAGNREIDQLLAEVQQLSIIRAKAMYTLQQRSKEDTPGFDSPQAIHPKSALN